MSMLCWVVIMNLVFSVHWWELFIFFSFSYHTNEINNDNYLEHVSIFMNKKKKQK